MANRVKFGLSNATVFPITQDTDSPATYGEPIKIPGSVTLSLNAEGSSDPFYADNIAYYVATSNNGYSGTLEVALIPDEILTKILGMKKDETSGAILESADNKNTAFALAFQFEGDANATRHIIYHCTATRPAVEGETKADTTTPKTETLEFTATPRPSDMVIKAKVEADSAAYEDFFTKPFEVTPGV